MFPNLSIRTRLTLLYSMLLFVALIVFGSAAVGLLRYRLTARLEASLDRRAKGLEDFLRRETTAAKASMIPEEAVEYAFTQTEGHLLGVTDGEGRTILRSDIVSQPALVRERRFELYGQPYFVRAAGSLDQVQETTRELTLLLVWSAPMLLLIIGARAPRVRSACTTCRADSRFLVPVMKSAVWGKLGTRCSVVWRSRLLACVALPEMPRMS